MSFEMIITSSNPAILFCLQLLLSTGIYCIYMKRRSCFVLKGVCCLAVLLAVAYSIDQLLYNVNPLVPFILWLLLIPMLYFLYLGNWREILFISLSGLATQHCSLIISELFLEELLNIREPLLTNSLMIPCYLFMTFLAYCLLARRIYRKIDIKIESRSLLLIAGAIVLFSMVLRRMIIDNLGFDYMDIIKVAIDLYSMLGCAVSLWLLFFANIVDELRLEQVMMEHMMQMEEEKHSFTETAVETINIKCHDLKHELERMRTGQQVISDETLQELEDSVTNYSRIAKTGNDVLDNILTEESLCCERYHIHFRCIVDGAQLNGMDSTDLYSLFGNALDNAIEASRQEPEEDKRSIFLKVTKKGPYIIIHIENNCPCIVQFKDGIPQTDKEDKAHHGYGFRSMQYVVRKYDGSLVPKQENGLFSINIILNIPAA